MSKKLSMFTSINVAGLEEAKDEFLSARQRLGVIHFLGDPEEIKNAEAVALAWKQRVDSLQLKTNKLIDEEISNKNA